MHSNLIDLNIIPPIIKYLPNYILVMKHEDYCNHKFNINISIIKYYINIFFINNRAYVIILHGIYKN